MSATLLALSAVPCQAEQSEQAPLIDRPEYHSETGIFDIEALEALGRVSDPAVSPDGKRVLVGISY